jgi:squalene-hopene/tetraprenyl-beta-curcumene cyclase
MARASALPTSPAIGRRAARAAGGRAFQYANAYYPDVDDTAVVAMAMDRAANDGQVYKDALARAREWIEGLQSANGGWGAFDADNDYDYLNYIPFADHGALLDPPTADVTARCLSLLGQLGEVPADNPMVARGVAFLLRTQKAAAGLAAGDELHLWNLVGALRIYFAARSTWRMCKAAAWLKTSEQRRRLGWGRELRAGLCGLLSGVHAVTTAWALLA